MTNYRALCAELVEELESWIGYGDEADCADAHAVVDRARAALAQPEPVAPTDEELRALWRLGWQSKDPEDGAVLFAEEVLARWGRPAIEPLPQQPS
jgi:hypothetical protein